MDGLYEELIRMVIEVNCYYYFVSITLTFSIAKADSSVLSNIKMLYF